LSSKRGALMKRILLVASAIVGLVFAGGASAAPIPPGSYQSSCEKINVRPEALSAACDTRRGGWNYFTPRHYEDCEGDIANVDGRLRCVRDDDDRDQNDDDWLPPGSYRETCRRETMVRGTLTADCQDRNGRWRYTELQNARACRGDVANQD